MFPGPAVDHFDGQAVSVLGSGPSWRSDFLSSLVYYLVFVLKGTVSSAYSEEDNLCHQQQSGFETAKVTFPLRSLMLNIWKVVLCHFLIQRSFLGSTSLRPNIKTADNGNEHPPTFCRETLSICGHGDANQCTPNTHAGKHATGVLAGHYMLPRYKHIAQQLPEPFPESSLLALKCPKSKRDELEELRSAGCY